MNFFDKQFRKGSTFMLSLFIVMTLFFAFYAVFEPDDRTFSLVLFVVGLFGSWRQYLAWNQKRQ